jgi:hypothetical protein
MTSGAYVLVSSERKVAESNIVHTEVHVCYIRCSWAQGLPRRIAWHFSKRVRIVMALFRIGEY